VYPLIAYVIFRTSIFRVLFRTSTAALIGLFFFSLSIPASGEEIWRTVQQAPLVKSRQEAWIRPAKSRLIEMDIPAWSNAMKRVPVENLALAAAPSEIITLPMPDGTSARFRITESSVMAPELAAKFPEIKTFVGVGIDDPAASVRLDWTPQGFHGQILSPNGSVYIDPYSKGDQSLYSVYFKQDLQRSSDFQCTVRDREPAPFASRQSVTPLRAGPTLRTYQLACAATAEYTAFHGGTVTQAQAAIVTAINRINGVYEVEVGIRLILVADNGQLVYTNAVADPYTNNDGDAMLDENQANVDTIIGTGNYDIGHVFSTGGGGIAGLGVVCVISRKAQGVTGQASPIGDPFYIDYVAHEMGHQFNADHTFNSETSSCGGNRNASTAFEPGSGSTIMSYAGICGADNLQGNSNPYFHSISFDQIIAYIASEACDTQSGTGNSAPTVSAGNNYVIPANTPFILSAEGSDINGDSLTYCWEERDLGIATTLAAADNGSSPLFRSFSPTTNSWRTFPRLSNILNGTSSLGEKLPTTSRAMNFRVTARDNKPGGGGVNTDDMMVTVSTNSGPFVVTVPNTAVTWSSQQTVSWNVAKTTGTPVNASSVDIHLSIDGGFTWPYVLALGTPNDGSESVILPNIVATNSRIKVQGSNNIFFDVSNVSFGITTGTPLSRIIVESITFTNETCADSNGALDPNEYADARVVLRNIGSLHATNVSASILTTTNVTSLSGAQSYGTLFAGGASVTQSFTVISSGGCGASVRLLTSIAIGTNHFGILTNSIILGPQVSVTFENASAIAVPVAGDTIGQADPYPSIINVSGFIGNIVNMTVTISGMSHTYPDDVDVLLVGPGGQKVMLMSDVGGSVDINGVQLIFNDSGESLPNSTAISSGTYRPTNSGTSDPFDSPAPASPYSTALGSFSNTNPNGVWSLYIMDDTSGDSGTFSGGWSLNIDAPFVGCCTQAVVAPILSVSPSNLSFGVMATGTTAQLSFTVGNVGGGILTGTVSAVGSPFSLPFSSSLFIPSAGSTNVIVQFSPGTTNAAISNVIFLSNGGGRTNLITGQGGILPAAAFMASPTNGTTGWPVMFIDSSLGSITNRLWNFGDGASINTFATNVVHTYQTAGVYTVSLAVSGPLGVSTNVKVNAIEVVDPPLLAVTPSNLMFGIAATGTTVMLDFTVANNGGSTLTGSVSLGAGAFNLTPTSFTVAASSSTNVTVEFTPPSEGMFSNPVVFASNGGGSANVVMGEGVIPVSAVFTASPTSGLAPHIVMFEDISTGTITNRLWIFGDGESTNTLMTNVVHTYQTTGVFNVSLVVDGPLGVSSNEIAGYIHVTTPALITVTPPELLFGVIPTGFNKHLSFDVGNAGGIVLTGTVSISGGPFTLPFSSALNILPGDSTNVFVEFETDVLGIFSNEVVFLSNGGASTNVVSGEGAIKPVATFTASPTNGLAPQLVAFEDTSTGTISNRAWNFGDGEFTNTLSTNLVHNYQTAGVFTVSLLISGPLGVSSNVQNELIVVTNILFSDLAVFLAAVPEMVTTNQILRYDVLLTNSGPEAALGLVLTNTPSPVAVFDELLSSGECVETNGVIICTMAPLPSGSATSLVISVAIDSGATGFITNRAAVSSSHMDTNESDNTSIAVTLIQDFDGDGSPDFADDDDDGDTVSDEDEFIADTDATDSNSYHRILSIAQPLLTEVTFPSSTGRIYYMEVSTNLPDYEWIMTGSNVPGIGGVMTLFETNAVDALHYRIGVQMP